jgi:2,3-bisphosphoglycerate-independent phosphoglycerate mutase
MKRITVVLDGVADRPNAKLDNKTPLEYASTPNLDRIASKSQIAA